MGIYYMPKRVCMPSLKHISLMSKCPVLIKGNKQRATITFTVPLAIEWSTFVLVDNGRN